MTYQTGYYKYDIAPFVKYLHYLKGSNPTAAYLPPEIPRKSYDPEFEKQMFAAEKIRKKRKNLMRLLAKS